MGCVPTIRSWPSGRRGEWSSRLRSIRSTRSWPRSRGACSRPRKTRRGPRATAGSTASASPMARPITGAGSTSCASSGMRSGPPASRLHSSCGARPTSSVHGRGSAFRRTIPRRSSVPVRARDCCGSSAERMTDPSRVLRPLDEAEHAIHMLEEYRTADELGRAVVDSWRAVDHSLRLLLRSDPEVPDELRLAALSPDELPLERLLNALRHRGLISLELAGSAHELGRAAERAQHGDVRAVDGDLALRVVARLREEVTAPRPSEPEKEPLVLVREEREEGAEPETGVTLPPERWSGARRLTIAAAVVSVLVLVAFLFVLVRWFDD